MVSILHALAEPSLLYRGLSTYVQAPPGGDLIHQSLRAAVGAELRSYLGLVASLESEIRRALATLDVNDAKSGIGKAGVTLKRCIIWTREATKGLRLMSVIVEESSSRSSVDTSNLVSFPSE
jgi:gamma-tubulin complex component 3